MMIVAAAGIVGLSGFGSLLYCYFFAYLFANFSGLFSLLEIVLILQITCQLCDLQVLFGYSHSVQAVFAL